MIYLNLGLAQTSRPHIVPDARGEGCSSCRLCGLSQRRSPVLPFPRSSSPLCQGPLIRWMCRNCSFSRSHQLHPPGVQTSRHQHGSWEPVVSWVTPHPLGQILKCQESRQIIALTSHCFLQLMILITDVEMRKCRRSAKPMQTVAFLK